MDFLVTTAPNVKRTVSWGAWMAQSLKCSTLNFGSRHNLRVKRSSPSLALHWAWSWLKILSLPLLPHPFSHSCKNKKSNWSSSESHLCSHTNYGGKHFFPGLDPQIILCIKIKIFHPHGVWWWSQAIQSELNMTKFWYVSWKKWCGGIEWQGKQGRSLRSGVTQDDGLKGENKPDKQKEGMPTQVMWAAGAKALG